MERLVPTRGTYRWEEADALVDWALAHGKAVHGHTLVYGNQNPWWVERGTWTRESLLAVTEQHISTVMSRYKGRVASWDVVDEPYDAAGGMRDNVWLRVIGPDYVERAFAFAHAADPDAVLFLNETAADVANAKSDHMHEQVSDLKLRGVPIDGVGFQHHPSLLNPPSRARVEGNLRRFALLGLQVAITEMDVAAGLDGSLDQQAQVYADVAGACAAVPECGRLTVWGVSDKWSWLGADQRPLLLDATYARKPAWSAVQAALGPTGP